MLFSQIKMYQKNGWYQCKIKHSGHIAESSWFVKAASAYRDAESKLIFAPGYVQRVSLEDYT